MSNPQLPLKSADPVTFAVMEAVDRSGLDLRWVAKRAGVHVNQLRDWRSGRSSANARSLGYLLEAIGATFAVTDINARKPAPTRLASLNAIRRAVGRG